ncbi:MAG: hypothetical protein IT328_19465 [Caldilineaceae bacterium]|nr:hypothetical protein [Caldilineaceae bacterium]
MLQEEIQPAILKMLVEDVPRNLQRFDPTTNRFLTEGGWAVTNQDIVYPMALLYTTEHPDNPYYQDGELLEIIGRAGDAWRDFQYPDGKVEFIKVDGSTWGPTYMPWSMYHWVETYGLLCDQLDEARRQRWEEGLTLAYDGITQQIADGRVHNIPCWNGMASFRAGQIFGRADWQEAGRRMIHLTVGEQQPQGYWDEHGGPTTSYNLVYLHAIGLYYFFSGDENVLDCLRRGTEFHIRYTYPDGCMVETIDGRVKYHHTVIESAYPAFSLFPEGRRFVRFLLENLLAQRAAAPEPHVTYIITNGERKPSGGNFGLSTRLASALAHYQVGAEAAIPQDSSAYQIHDEGIALIRRQDGWFTAVSGFMVPAVESRWGLDRQAFCSIWHDQTGLIIGGGNAKSQPAFSNFVFTNGSEPLYLPDSAHLRSDAARDTVELDYGGPRGVLTVEPQDNTRLLLQLEAPAQPAHSKVVGQLMFRIAPGDTLRTGAGAEVVVDETPITFTAEEAGGSIAQGKWRIHLPAGSIFQWPVAPFNPYAADGAAPIEEAAAIVTLAPSEKSGQLAIEILG